MCLESYEQGGKEATYDKTGGQIIKDGGGLSRSLDLFLQAVGSY